MPKEKLKRIKEKINKLGLDLQRWYVLGLHVENS
jgi:hypothetical protein